MNWFFFSLPTFFFFFLSVSYLIVFILAWFVTIIHKQTCQLDLFQAENVMGMFPVCFLCVMTLMTAETPRSRCWKIFAGWAKLLISPSASSRNNWTRTETRGVLFRELNCRAKIFVFCVLHLWFECLFDSFIDVCTQMPNFIVLW